MSPHICSSCRRLNPPLAAYCYFDGTPLAIGTRAPRAFGSEQFPTPFVLPSGRLCRSFEELARTARHSWEEARRLLKEGGYRSFLLTLGRSDLAQAADQAAQQPNLDLGLDEFLARLPGCQPAPPRLELNTTEIDLGTVIRGQDRDVPLTIQNTGERLLCGLVRSVDCLWLGVGTPHLKEYRFQASADEQLQFMLHIRGRELRAALRPLIGNVVVESNGGGHSIEVRVRVPVTPFPDGVLKGAQTARQLAERVGAAPHEAARLLENGSVARWYECNGWTYPLTGPTATGLAAVRQFFEALGLPMPTGIEPGTNAVPRPGASGRTTHERIVLPSGQSPTTGVKPRGHTGFDLPPLPDAGLPPLPDQAMPGPGREAIPLAEARADSAAARSRRRLSCVCLLLSFILLTSSAALAAWKLLNAYRESLPPPPVKAPAAAGKAPEEGVRVRGCPHGTART